MPTVEDYLSLLPAFNRAQQQLRATIAAYIEPFVAQQDFLNSLIPAFDLDTAVGVQLDAVGVWVGRSRFVGTPLANVFFSWGIPGLGWGEAVWKGPFDPVEGLVRLDDTFYRLLLRAKIAANSWDGTVTDARAALRLMFTELLELAASPLLDEDGNVITGEDGVPILTDPELFQGFYVEDTFQMKVIFGLSGLLPPVVFLALWIGGYIPLKPAGVKARYIMTSVNRTPVFGWGVNNGYIGGWGTGSWATDDILKVEF